MDTTLFYVDPLEVKLNTDLPRFRKEMGDVKSLAISISDKGQLQPIVVTEDMHLVAGGRRLAACMYGQMKVLCRKIKDTNPLYLRELELLENVERKDFTPAERAEAIAEIHRIKQGQADIANPHGIRETADLLGVSRSQVQRALDVAEVLQQHPELKAAKTTTAITKAATTIAKQLACVEAIDKNKKLLDTNPTALQAKIEQCDMIDFMQRLCPRSIDILFTDPVYGISIDKIGQGAGGVIGGVSGQGFVYDDSADNALMLLKYLAKQSAIVCKPDSHAFVFVGPEHFHAVRGFFTAAGWDCYIKPIIWIKRETGQTNQPSRWPSSCYEMLLYARMPEASLIKEGQPDWIDCLPLTSTQKLYPTEKPLPLLRNLLSRVAIPGMTMLDPFMGSGALVIAGIQEGLFTYACDIAKEAYGITMMKLAAEQKTK